MGIYEDTTQADITGIDINPRVVAEMKARYKGAKFMKADAEKLPFKAQTFDRIYCLHVLEHVDDPLQVLQQAKRVLKIGGNIYIAVPHRHFETIAKHILPDYHGPLMHKRVFTPNNLITVVKQKDLRIKQIKSRRFVYAVLLTIWFMGGRLRGWTFQTHIGRLTEKNRRNTKLLERKRTPMRQIARRIADFIDGLPFVSLFNTLYPFETLLIASKTS